MVENLDRDAQLPTGGLNGVLPAVFTGERYNAPINNEVTIWTGPTDLYTFTDETTDTITHISSSDAGDTGIPVAISGIDPNWDLYNQVAVLNGQSKTALTQPLIRVNAVRALQQAAGNIYVYEDDTVTNGVPDTLSKVKGYVDPEINVMSAAIYSVPRNYNATLKAYYAQARPPATGCIYVRLYFKEYGLAIVRSANLAFCTSGTTISDFTVPLAFAFPPKTDLIAQALATVVNAGVFFNASMVLRRV